MAENEKVETPKGKRNWIVWVIVGILALCLLSCCLAIVVLDRGNMKVSVNSETTMSEQSTTKNTQVPTCTFATGYSADGKVFSSDIKVHGPAIVKIASDYIIVVNPGTSFEAPTGSTVWRYSGDLACLNAQIEFFQGFRVRRVIK